MTDINIYFDNLIIASANIRPCNIYNMDESGFMSQGEQNIICKKGARNAYMFTGDGEKKQYTINVCGNASGDYLPLYILYKGKHLYSDSCRGAPPGSSFREGGWSRTP
jgi:hypothetical protein